MYCFVLSSLLIGLLKGCYLEKLSNNKGDCASENKVCVGASLYLCLDFVLKEKVNEVLSETALELELGSSVREITAA